jgi:hypothetical protein
MSRYYFIRAFLSGLFVVGGYALLVAVDWRIALAVFVIHWSINLDRKAP